MEIRCKKCGSDEQIKRGFTGAGSQKYFCKKCGAYYTPNPKRYNEEEKKVA